MKKITNIVAIVSIVLISFLVLGYIIISDASAIDSIIINVENVTIQDLKLKSCELKLDIKITNPTPNQISDLTANFDIFISNTDVGDGKLSKISIVPISSEISEVYLTIFYANVGQAVINGLQTGDFQLRISGEAKINIFFNFLSATKPFSASYSYK